METKNSEESIADLAAKFVNNTAKNVFLTGKAGTGKTTFLKHITKNTYKNTAIVAPTGIAAINAGGVTIHSLFQLPFGAYIPSNDLPFGFSDNTKVTTPKTLFKNLQLSITKRKLIQELELLIVDEVSMLRADLLDAMDNLMRTVRRRRDVAFGGVQVLFIGDLMQLPPVVKDDEWRYLKHFYKSAFFFEARAIQQSELLYLELDKIYRQQDDTFINLLNNLRNNQVTKEDVALLNKYHQPNFVPPANQNYIRLTTHNYIADDLNKKELQKLNSTSYFYKATITGDFNQYAYPVEETLELKKGAQIMFIKNDPTGAQRFFNGKIGIVESLDDETICVRFEDSQKVIEVEKYDWKNLKYSVNETTNEIVENEIGTYTHYPIKLAWAITVHKSQGLTFERAIVDIGNAFAPGQVYVALSRLTSLNGLVLSSPINYSSIEVSNEIVNFAATKKEPNTLQSIFDEASIHFFQNYISSGFDLNELLIAVELHASTYKSQEHKSLRMAYSKWFEALHQELIELKTIADKFMVQVKNIFVDKQQFNKEFLQQRVEAAHKHFYPLVKKLSAALLKQVENLKTQKKLKAYLKELVELDAMVFKQLQLMEKAKAMCNTIVQSNDLNKASIQTDALNKERSEATLAVPIIAKRERKRKAEGEPKKEKVNTKEVSYTLYKENKTIEEIAKERGMSALTIEGHLAHYVGLGMIDYKIFVDEEKAKNIYTVSKELNTTLFSPIKAALGDEYSYSDIRFAMAFYQNANTKED
jgi:PIF1-like helicase/Helix-turn-helix domain